jgi:hypothetical protein
MRVQANKKTITLETICKNNTVVPPSVHDAALRTSASSSCH